MPNPASPGLFPLLLVLAGLGAALPARAGYGEEAKQYADPSQTVPTGWVIVQLHPGRSLSASSLATSPAYWTIRDLRGARTGAKCTILAGSPVPKGWVVTQIHPSISGLPKDQKLTIEYVAGYPKGTLLNIYAAADYGVPEGWIITRQQTTVRWGEHPVSTIKCLDAAQVSATATEEKAGGNAQSSAASTSQSAGATGSEGAGSGTAAKNAKTATK